jgi:hypothetical protein
LVQKERRARLTGVDKLNEPPLCNTHNGQRFFKGEANVFYGDKFVSCLFWASTEGMNLLHQSDHMFVDGTFKCVPKPYKQLLIIMGHHMYTRVHFPAVFVLMNGKSEYAYDLALNIILSWKGKNLLPKIVTADFEIGLINSLLRNLSSDSNFVGCYFHFKHSIQRKLKKMGCSLGNISYISNLCGVLCVVEEDKLNLVLEYISEKSVEHDKMLSNIMTEFSLYFKEFWFPKFNLWNVSRFIGELPKLKRTNNCLERYNRRINSNFPHAHPSIMQLVGTLRNEESYFSQYIQSIQVGVQRIEEPEDTEFPSKKDFEHWCDERFKAADYLDDDNSEWHFPHDFLDTIEDSKEISSKRNPSSEMNNSDDETFLSALSFRDDPVLEDTSFKMTVDAMRTYIMDPKKVRVPVVREFLASLGCPNQKLKKAELIEKVKIHLK